MNKDKINDLLDHLYQAASLADQVKIRIPEIYDLIDIVSEELETAR
jgi:hypothetical protein